MKYSHVSPYVYIHLAFIGYGFISLPIYTIYVSISSLPGKFGFHGDFPLDWFLACVTTRNIHLQCFCLCACSHTRCVNINRGLELSLFLSVSVLFQCQQPQCPKCRLICGMLMVLSKTRPGSTQDITFWNEHLFSGA